MKGCIKNLKNKPQKYWFRQKLYGWGWTPATWQGWLVTLVYIGLVIIFALTIDAESPKREIIFTFIIPAILLTITLFRILREKSEKPKWMWGKPKDDDTNSHRN